MNHGILEVKSFLSPQECSSLVEYQQLYASEGGYWSENNSSSEWDNRQVGCDNLKDSHVRTIIEAAHYRLSVIGSLFYNEECVYPDYSCLTYWGPGMEMEPHADNVFVDRPHVPHYSPQRDYSVVVYLNEEFEGGHTFFPQYEHDVIPETGKLLMFPSGTAHVHGVSKIISGERYTLAAWFTKNRKFLFKINSI